METIGLVLMYWVWREEAPQVKVCGRPEFWVQLGQWPIRDSGYEHFVNMVVAGNPS